MRARGPTRRVDLLPSVTPHLEHAEFLRLLALWRDHGDRAARDRIIFSYIPLAKKLAKKLARVHWMREEAINEAMLALPVALEKFDAKRGTTFATYAALWIRAYVLRYALYYNSPMTTRTRDVRKAWYGIARAARDLEQELFAPASTAQIAERLGLPEEAVSHVLMRVNARQTISLQQYAHGQGSKVTVGDLLPADTLDAEDELDHVRRERVARALARQFAATLDERLRSIFVERMIAHDDEKLSLEELGMKWSLSRERIRQLEQRLRGRFEAFAHDEARRVGFGQER